MRPERSAEKPNGGIWEFSTKNSLVSPDYVQEIKKPFLRHLAMASSISENLLKEAEKWKLKGVYQGSSSIHGSGDESSEDLKELGKSPNDTLFFVFENNLRTKMIKNGSHNPYSVLTGTGSVIADYYLQPPLNRDLSQYDFINEALSDTDRRVVSMRAFYNGIHHKIRDFLRRKNSVMFSQTGVIVFEVFTEKVEVIIEELKGETKEALTKEQQFITTVSDSPSPLFEPHLSKLVETT